MQNEDKTHTKIKPVQYPHRQIFAVTSERMAWERGEF